MKHQKRLSAPRHYPIERKNGAYVVAGQGPHPEEASVPVTVLLRDVLEYADTAAEAKEILNTGNVHVNGRPVHNEATTVGFMDVISIKPIDTALRITADRNGVALTEIGDPEKRLYRIEDKTTLTGGITQLNLDGGVNKEVDGSYDTRSSVVVDLESGDIIDELPLDEGMLVYIVGGTHSGKMATVNEVQTVKGPQPNRVVCEQETDTFETIEDYVYVIGDGRPEVEV